MEQGIEGSLDMAVHGVAANSSVECCQNIGAVLHPDERGERQLEKHIQ